jgi:hypothetical protein
MLFGRDGPLSGAADDDVRRAEEDEVDEDDDGDAMAASTRLFSPRGCGGAPPDTFLSVMLASTMLLWKEGEVAWLLPHHDCRTKSEPMGRGCRRSTAPDVLRAAGPLLCGTRPPPADGDSPSIAEELARRRPSAGGRDGAGRNTLGVEEDSLLVLVARCLSAAPPPPPPAALRPSAELA